MKHKFQYSILLYRHDISTDERINVGVAIYCPDIPFFACKTQNRYERLTNTFPGADGKFFKKYINRLQNKFDSLSEKINTSQISIYSSETSISTITNNILKGDDSSIFFSTIQSGLTEDPDMELENLFARKVDYYLNKIDNSRKNDNDVWNIFKKPLQENSVFQHLEPRTVILPKDEIEFEFGWKNGRQNVIRPLSFDLSDSTYIKKKAHEWRGILNMLEEAKDLSSVYLLIGGPTINDTHIEKAFTETLDILNIKTNNYRLHIYDSSQNEKFASELKPIIEHDLLHN